MNRGLWYGIAAYVCWGLSPVYWKQVDSLAPAVLIGHRVLWALLVLGALLWMRPADRFMRQHVSTRIIGTYAVTAALLYVNWLTFVWAVTSGFIVEVSLGYFLSPLITVSLGVVVLGERLRPAQWTAVGLASTGLLYLTTAAGSLPWIAVLLAVTFGLYGLVKKQAPLGTLRGLSIETGLLSLPAVGFLLAVPEHAPGVLAGGGPSLWLLAASGLVTIGPLLLFGASVRRIPLSHMGIIQYLAPTLQFLLGVLVYGEPFTPTQFVGYGFVWLALLLFGVEGAYAHRTLAAPVGGAP